jgi:hypothetical protein
VLLAYGDGAIVNPAKVMLTLTGAGRENVTKSTPKKMTASITTMAICILRLDIVGERELGQL